MKDYNLHNIKVILDKMIKRNNLEQGLDQVQVKQAWRNVMGEGTWTYTKSISLKSNNLTVCLLSSTLREEYSYRKDEIVKMLNEYLKKQVVKKIRFI
jgi:hypothetical protein